MEGGEKEKIMANTANCGWDQLAQNHLSLTVKPENKTKITIDTDIIACPELRSFVIAEKILKSNPIPTDDRIAIKTNMI